MRRMESRIAGTTRRVWSGKPPPIQPEGKLRSVNLESAAGRQPFRRGRAGIKPSSRTNLEDGSSFAARHCEDRLDSRCGDAKPQESHREPTQFTRRPISGNSKDRPNARRDADLDERSPDERRRSRNQAENAYAKRPQGESRDERDDGSYHTPWKPGQRRTSREQTARSDRFVSKL